MTEIKEIRESASAERGLMAKVLGAHTEEAQPAP